MNRLFQVVVLCYISLVVFLVIDFGEANDTQLSHNRLRRFLSFNNITHFFISPNNGTVKIHPKVGLFHYSVMPQQIDEKIEYNQNIFEIQLRVNFKANMVPWNQIFAQAIGFRINWDDPPDSFHPYHRLYRRDVYKHLETVLNSNGLNGFHCVRRAICETEMMTQSGEIYHKILKMIFRKQSEATDRWHNTTEHDCNTSISSCPFSMLEVSRFTDII